MTNQHDQPQGLPVPLTLAPEYGNAFSVSHGPDEFLLAFGFLMGHHGQAHTLVAVSPATAKRVAQALASNVARYEGRYGEIGLGDEESPSG